jgi:GH25 family lysozyme M1 (1,4-beta-N-acetylmuramidase)
MIFVDGNIIGPDVSFYQDDNSTPQEIDFNKMKSKSSFVIIRAGQNYWIDPDFNHNWYMAKRAGLPRGSYWFYDSRVPAEAQAEIFASLFRLDRPELELWIDLEETYNGTYSSYTQWERFLERLKILVPGAKIGVYTGYGYFVGKLPISRFEYWKQYPLWLASYNSISLVRVPMPWKDDDVKYWQWGTPTWGADFGVESKEIDMNLYNGFRESFNQRYNLSTVPPVPIGDVNMDNITLTADLKTSLVCNVREAADTSSPLVGTITGPATIKGIGEKATNDGFEWIQIISPKVGFVALTSQFQNIVYTPPTTETVSKKVVKSTILFDDNTTLDLYPQ